MSNAADTAANFGYSMAFFNSDAELKKLLNSAVKGNWTPSTFVAKLQGTKWFKVHGEAARQLYALKTSDPATYKQRVASSRASVAQMAYQMGAPVPGAQMALLAEHALSFGWTQDQIKAALVQYVHADKNGAFRGGAAQMQSQIKEMASAYGYSPSASQVGNWVKALVAGSSSIDQIKQNLIVTASSRFPALKDRLASGETLEDIAAPYKDSYSRILEVNPQTIKLNDPMLQKALSTKDQKGKPSTQTVWQFEQSLRSDPRWLSTKGAQDQLVGETHKALQSFGLMN